MSALPDPIALEIFKHLFASAAEEMGITLGRTGFSPNIKERRDYSCAVFLGDGRLLAQAAHIPVHLGAMPASVKAAIAQCAPFRPGDLIVLNDPYLGGTHLPDITLVSPFYASESDPTPAFYVASRAHHADIGGISPGSMPIATELVQEGLIIPPVRLVEAGRLNQGVWDLILRNSRTSEERAGDLRAQTASHEVGARRLRAIIGRYGLEQTQAQAAALIDYAERLTRTLISSLPDGVYTFEDWLDDDGQGQKEIAIRVRIDVQGDALHCDFGGSSPAVSGSLNAVRAIVESAALYVLRCLAGEALPSNQGVLAPVRISLPQNSVLNPQPGHAVAGGNVETSQRVVDVLFGALAQAVPDRIPAASQGTMNNFSFGGQEPTSGQRFAYYETIGGGAGAGPDQAGASGIHCHMSNTLNTPIEALEMAFPLRIERYALRRGSGGAGRQRGGDGLIRSFRFLAPVQATLLTERRLRGPYGLAGGSAGQAGCNTLHRRDGRREALPGKISLRLEAGEGIEIETPGGGGWG